MESLNTSLQTIEINPSCFVKDNIKRSGRSHGHKSLNVVYSHSTSCFNYDLSTGQRKCQIRQGCFIIFVQLAQRVFKGSLSLQFSSVQFYKRGEEHSLFVFFIFFFISRIKAKRSKIIIKETKNTPFHARSRNKL